MIELILSKMRNNEKLDVGEVVFISLYFYSTIRDLFLYAALEDEDLFNKLKELL